MVDIRDNPDKYDDLSNKVKAQSIKAIAVIDELFQRYPDLYYACERISGALQSCGAHAGGIVISGVPLAGNVPLTKGSEATVLPILQIEMGDIPFYRILKIDGLGLRTLDQIKDCMDLVGLGWDWYDKEDFSDSAVYEFLRQGYTTDIFQFSSPSATNMLKDFNVSSIADLMKTNAGNRPGCIAKDKTTGKSMVDIQKETIAKGEPIKIHPIIDEILKETNGCIWYQEDCQKLGQAIAGYTLGQADLRIRKIFSKKAVEKIPELEIEFVYGVLPKTDENGHVLFKMLDGSEKAVDTHHKDAKSLVQSAYQEGGIPQPSDKPSTNCTGAIHNGFTVEFAYKMFNMMRSFALYSFNKSHAGCYSVLGYLCAWLSYYHPVEWAVACASNYDDNDKIKETILSLKRRGYKVLPPSVNYSDTTFTVELLPDNTKAMRYGLVDIPYVGDRAVGILKIVRDATGKFTSFDDFLTRCTDTNNQKIRDYLGFNKAGNSNANPINKSCIVNLIKAGAFDELEENRYKLLNYYLMAIRKENVMTVTDKDAKDKKSAKKEIPLPLDEANYARRDKLALEKEIMGSYISEHPLDPFPSVDFDTCGGGFVSFAAIVLKKEGKKTKKGDPYTELKVEVKGGTTMIARLFKEVHNDYAKFCKKDAIIMIQGKYDTGWNNVTVNRIAEITATNTPQLNDDSALIGVFDTLIPVRPDIAGEQEIPNLNSQSLVDLFSLI